MSAPDRPEPAERAGRYVRQTADYRVFLPTPLPPNPPVRLGGELNAILSRADRALGRLDGSVVTLPNPDFLVFMYVRKEAVLSSQIEGTQSSLQDLLAAQSELFEPAELPRDVNEVINYVAAMNHGLARLSELPVSVRLIREIHERLLQGVRGARLAPGELRRTQNWIGPGGAGIANATFVPPPPGDVPRALGDLETFLHGDDDLPLLIRIGLAHAQFETIHPFLDGNGRVGRLLITFLLTERGALHKPVLYLSHWFKQNRQEYYDRLQAVRDRGDWEGWLGFFLRGVERVSVEERRRRGAYSTYASVIARQPPAPRPRGRQRPQSTRGALSRTDRNGGGRATADRRELRGGKRIGETSRGDRRAARDHRVQSESPISIRRVRAVVHGRRRGAVTRMRSLGEFLGERDHPATTTPAADRQAQRPDAATPDRGRRRPNQRAPRADAPVPTREPSR